MRRGSLVGPLLIILIGVWFLVSSLRPDLPLLDLAARFWPFVLIGWGVLRTVEILFWTARGRPLPYAGVSGGEWTLIVFICLIGSGLYALNRYRPWQQLRGHHQQPHRDLRPPLRLRGGGTDRAGAQGRPRARRKPSRYRPRCRRRRPASPGERPQDRPRPEGDRSRQSAEADPRRNLHPGRPDCRPHQPGPHHRRPARLDRSRNHRPAARVEIRGRNGDLEVTGVNGPVEISSDSASVRLQNIAGNVRLDLGKSDLVRAGSIKGNIEMQGGRGRDIELDTIGGEITINGSYSGDLQFRNCARPIRFQSGQTDLRVEKLPGEIHLDLGEFQRLQPGRPHPLQLQPLARRPDRAVHAVARTSARARRHHPAPARQSASQNRRADALRPDRPRAAGIGQIRVEGHHQPRRPQQRLRPGAQNRIRERPHPQAGGTIIGSVGQGPAITLTTDRGTVTVRKDTGMPPRPPRPPKPPDVEISTDKASVVVEKH